LEDADSHDEAVRISGRIKWFDPGKGYGFIVPDEPDKTGLKDVLLHITSLRDSGRESAMEGATIICDVIRRPKGWQVASIFELDESAAPPPIDRIGFLLSGVATSGIVFGLSVVSLPALPPSVGIVVAVVGLLSGLLYIVHARRHPAPILNLSLFSAYPTFRTAVLGGTLFRIATGAIPFLLPLMLQLGFGLTPFQSGSITFVGAIGAFSTKMLARRTFRLGGFRTVLTTALAVGSILTGVNGLFQPDTPYFIIIAALMAAGFARSFFFTGVNALTFAEVDTRDTSQATAIAAVVQQISLALGVALGGTLLEVSSSLKGAQLSLSDFHVAFFGIACLSATALIPFSRLPHDAGEDVSGHHRTPATASPRS
jgi:cold shock CspA family protein